jgi:uncharacterized membrane protein YcaP (DUF421 family)
MQNKQNLNLFDPSQWLFGLTPPWFLIEISFRAILIYVLLQVILRFMGRRVASQMTISELAVVVTLGAAIGVPLQAPEQGVLAAVLILLVALAFQRMMGWLTFRFRSAEIVAMGDVLTVIEDGRMVLNVMSGIGISRERLFSVLRGKGLEHLGQIRRVYAEPSGGFSIYSFRESKPGLSILPVFDHGLRNGDRKSQGHWA